MSFKYALIFALAALCCLTSTEAGTQRRNGLARAALVQQFDDVKVSDDMAEHQAPEQEQELDQQVQNQETVNKTEVKLKENTNAVDSNQNKQKETLVRSSEDDGRARRVIRRRRRGPRRNRRRNGRRGNGRRRRNGNRRNGGTRRRSSRRRNGRPLRG